MIIQVISHNNEKVMTYICMYFCKCVCRCVYMYVSIRYVMESGGSGIGSVNVSSG